MTWRIFVAVLLLFFPIDLIIYFLHIFGLFPKIYLMDKRLGKCFAFLIGLPNLVN